jgi:hypothetical protein
VQKNLERSNGSGEPTDQWQAQGVAFAASLGMTDVDEHALGIEVNTLQIEEVGR